MPLSCAVGVAAGAKAHHDLLQCGIAGAFADSADRAFHLAGPGADSGKRVGHGKAKVVMAVRGHRRVSDALDAVHDGGDKRAEFVWRRIAYRVGYVDDRGAGGDGGLERLAEEVDVRSRRVFGRELHLAAELARVGHGVPYLPQAVGAGSAQLVLEVQVARCDESVDARPRRAADRRRRSLDVLLQRPRKRADGRGFDRIRYGLYRLEVSRRCGGETRLHHIDAKRFELKGHANLLVVVHRVSGGLFAVPERRVEYLYRFHLRVSFWGLQAKEKRPRLSRGAVCLLSEP